MLKHLEGGGRVSTPRMHNGAARLSPDLKNQDKDFFFFLNTHIHLYFLPKFPVLLYAENGCYLDPKELVTSYAFINFQVLGPARREPFSRRAQKLNA